MLDTTREVASGSGHTYRVVYPDHKRGFQIIVNGNLRDKDGRLVNSFTTMPKVPRIVDQELPVRTTPEPKPRITTRRTPTEPNLLQTCYAPVT